MGQELKVLEVNILGSKKRVMRHFVGRCFKCWRCSRERKCFAAVGGIQQHCDVDLRS